MPKYVFYLEPTVNTYASQVMTRYWRNIKSLSENDGMGNEATRYPCHVSLSSFFTLKSEQNVNNIINCASSLFEQVPNRESLVHMTCVKDETDDGSYYSKLLFQSKEMSNIVANVVSNCLNYSADIQPVQTLECLLYNVGSESSMKHIEEYTSIDCVRSTEWSDVCISLYETDDNLSYWKRVHKFQ